MIDTKNKRSAGCLPVLIAVLLYCVSAGLGHAADYLEMGRKAMGKPDYREAVEYLTTYIQNHPNNHEAYALRGVCYGAQKSYTLALQDFSKAIELSPAIAWYWRDRGDARHQLADEEAAKSDWREAYRLDPTSLLHPHQIEAIGAPVVGLPLFDYLRRRDQPAKVDPALRAVWVSGPQGGGWVDDPSRNFNELEVVTPKRNIVRLHLHYAIEGMGKCGFRTSQGWSVERTLGEKGHMELDVRVGGRIGRFENTEEFELRKFNSYVQIMPTSQYISDQDFCRLILYPDSKVYVVGEGGSGAGATSSGTSGNVGSGNDNTSSGLSSSSSSGASSPNSGSSRVLGSSQPQGAERISITKDEGYVGTIDLDFRADPGAAKRTIAREFRYGDKAFRLSIAPEARYTSWPQFKRQRLFSLRVKGPSITVDGTTTTPSAAGMLIDGTDHRKWDGHTNQENYHLPGGGVVSTRLTLEDLDFESYTTPQSDMFPERQTVYEPTHLVFKLSVSVKGIASVPATPSAVSPSSSGANAEQQRSAGGGLPIGMTNLGNGEYRWTKDNSVMVRVPAGTFTMGSPGGEGGNDEHPQHQAYLDEFYIDKYEVTNRQYKQFCDATSRSCPPDPNLIGMPRYFADYPDYPVVEVSWDDAVAYASWVGKRLPTEAEWEKAARGTDGRKYPWGNAAPGTNRYGNFADESANRRRPLSSIVTGYDDGYANMAPAGSFPAGASPYGCLDMAGNVWEWCNDWYDEGYYGKSTNNDPTGPTDGSSRVVRGGGWIYSDAGLRCASRSRSMPSDGGYCMGFRCARSP
jgi:formylglycine-generating enzyme required for sulfatase activity